MKISTKGRYGLRAMLDLALNASGDHVALGQIAERQEISESYLEQMFSTLRKAGLVKSVKGAQGGYVLADSPSKIKVGTVLRALEGNLSVIGDDSEIKETELNHFELCIRTHIWNKMNESINKIVDLMTLEDLAAEYNKLEGNSVDMFYI